MSKLTESFRDIGVINSYDFYGHGNVYISYTPRDNGRMAITANWEVVRPDFQTDPNAHWTDYGNKTFNVWGSGPFHEVKKRVLSEAQVWAGERYGITEWARDPFGSYGEAEFVKARTRELKKQIRAQEAQNA